MPHAENDGVRIYYEVEGDGTPLVLHIGFMGRLQDWGREDVGIAQALRDEYRLILMDPRGQGRSDKPHEAAAYARDRQVGDVLAVLDAAGVDRAAFWGYSMGAAIGFWLGLRAPRRVRALVLGGSAPDPRDAAVDLQDAAELRQGTMADYLTRMEARLGAPFPPAVREVWLTHDPLALAANREASASHPDLTAALPQIATPALIYAGDKDAPFAGAQRAAAAMPNATFVALPGANHGMAFRNKDAILPHVREFLGRYR